MAAIRSLLVLAAITAVAFCVQFLLADDARAGAPVNVTVNSTNDTNTVANQNACLGGNPGCTFRAAIQVSNNNGHVDTITVLPGTYNLTIDNVSGEEDLNQTGDLDIVDTAGGGLVINGSGAGDTILDSSQVSDRFFDIVSTQLTVNINDVTIRNGVASGDQAGTTCAPVTTFWCGGAIYSNSPLTVEGSVFTGNVAPAGFGGAIFTDNTDLVIRDSFFNENHALNCCGGAVNTWDGGSLLVEDTTMTGNTTGNQCCGGAIYGTDEQSATGGGTDITIRRSSLSGNTVGGNCCGGGIYSEFGSLLIELSQVNGNTAGGCCGGGVSVFNGPLAILNSQVNDNTMSSDCCGGGIYHDGESATLAITNTEVNGNQISQDCCGAGLYYTPSAGDQATGALSDGRIGARDRSGPSPAPGVANFGPPAVTALVEDSEFIGNFINADCCGGGIFNAGIMTISDSLIRDNDLFDNCCGGGVYTEIGELTLINTVVRENSAALDGAGVHLFSGALLIQRSAIVANGPGDGIVVGSSTAGGQPAAATIESSDICLNFEAGLRVIGTDLVVPATGNFWGAESGPEHPENPSGDGDLIVDSANGGSGNVLFEPFSEQPFTTECFADEEPGGGGGGPGAEEPGPTATGTPGPGAADDDEDGPVVTTGDGSSGRAGTSQTVAVVGFVAALLIAAPILARLRR